MVDIKAKDIKLVPIEKLTPDPKNENTHSEKQLEVLAKIIKANGFREPLIISNRSGYIISGNGRYESARIIGMEELPVIYQDFENEAEETRHRLASNEIARHAVLDEDKMIVNLKDLDIDLDGLDFEELGLIDFELNISEDEKDDPEFPDDDILPETEKQKAIISDTEMLINGDSLEELKKIPSNSIASIVSDPPYGLEFMGKDWDKTLPPVGIWQECIRVLKPGGYLVAASASRTYHRLAVQLEDLGLICHPMIGWIYGSGFPKATDLSKQFDKQAGVDREVVGKRTSQGGRSGNANALGECINGMNKEINVTTPSTDLAKKWDGYKYGLQALKPALEPIAVFQKPIEFKRMTDNIKEHGVGAFNIDACRVDISGKDFETNSKKASKRFIGVKPFGETDGKGSALKPNSQGRHPANLLHDGSEVIEETFLEQGGIRPGSHDQTLLTNKPKFKSKYSHMEQDKTGIGFNGKNDTGTASRFFNSLPITELDAPFLYQAKASKAERNEGLEGMEEKESPLLARQTTKEGKEHEFGGFKAKNQNFHPTVKPVKLMEWLIKLVTPNGETTLDPFMGSGTTGVAARMNGFGFIGIEREPEFFNIASARIKNENMLQSKQETLSRSC